MIVLQNEGEVVVSKRRLFFAALINDSGDSMTRCEIADPNDTLTSVHWQHGDFAGSV